MLVLLTDYFSLFNSLLEKLPSTHWLVPVACVLVLIKVLFAKCNWAFKLEVSNHKKSSMPARRAKH